MITDSDAYIITLRIKKKMKKFVFNIVLSATLSLAAISANAAIIEHGAYFTDTTDNLDWLNNTPLAGQSYNSVLGGFGG